MRLGHPGFTEVKKGIGVTSLIVVMIIIYHTYPMIRLRYCYSSVNRIEKLQQSLKQVLLQLKKLKQNHSRLVLKFKEFTRLKRNLSDNYENVRRRIYANTKELWYYVSHRLRKAVKEGLKPEQIQTIIKEVAGRKRWLLLDHEKLPALDGHEEWRRRESFSLSDLIQRRLHYLQNPADCRNAKKIVCEHDNCGFGCSFHHIAYCLVTAYALKRTLILGYFNWWHPMNNWTRIFYPLSETCTEAYSKIVPYISVNTTNQTPEIYLPLFRNIKLASVKPYIIPNDLAQRYLPRRPTAKEIYCPETLYHYVLFDKLHMCLTTAHLMLNDVVEDGKAHLTWNRTGLLLWIARLSGDPYSWWMGQMIKYMLKLRKLDVIHNNIALKSPIVGVHIRTTDKLDDEAKYYEMEEYMSHVEDYYAKLEMSTAVDQRRVYLATDNVEVLARAIAKYPQYTFYGDTYRAQIAAVRSRFTSEGLAGFLQDIHILSLCDYVVCTFSSNIGRLVLEIMQTRQTDATNRITSLDNRYYFTVFEIRRRLAVMRNKKIALNVGDLIEFQCVNDAVNGTVLRTNDSGRIPWYKTEEYLIQNPFPEYEKVPLNDNN